jgi:hypothetical protein
MLADNPGGRRLGARFRPAVAAGALALLSASVGACDRGSEHPRPARVVPSKRPVHPRIHRSPVRFTIAATGDLLIHSPIYDRARRPSGRYRFEPMFRYVEPYIKGADLALCHVETPMTSGAPSGYPRFNTPGDLARAIHSTGWDVCDTASNHSLDQGQRGIDATTRFLDRARVAHTGSFRSKAARGRITMLRAKGVRVAFLAYTALTNGLRSPHPWSLNLARRKLILSDARRARRRGARVVIVNVHWGTEFSHRPDAQQTRLARQLTRSRRVTAVVGQHVHVVQPIRRINGKLVVFGEGNLISNQTAACCPAASQDGLIAILRIVVDHRGDRVAAVRYVPTWVRHPDFAVLPVRRAQRRGWAAAASLRQSQRRTVGVLGRGRGFRPAR